MLLRILICLFAALGSLSHAPVCPAQETSEQKKLAEQGISLLKKANYAEAEEVFSRWAERDGSDANAHYYLALSQALQEKPEQALIGFRRALTLAPKMADAYFEIAGIYFKKRNILKHSLMRRRACGLHLEASMAWIWRERLPFSWDRKLKRLDIGTR